MIDKEMNLVIIQLDGLRRDRLNFCPHLNSLFNQSIFFSNMITVSPYTFTSNPAFFTGLYPSKNGIGSYYSMFKFKKDLVKTLTQYFKEAGFYTFADVLNDCVLPAQGFDEMYIHNMEDDLISLHKKILFDLKNKKKKFFTYLHYTTIHDKYIKIVREFPNQREGYQKYSENFLNNINEYNQRVIETDQYIGKLINFINELNLLKNTIVVIFSDHGTNNGEKLGEKLYGCFTYDSTIRTFCSILLPSKFQKQINFQTRTIDVMPTLLELFEMKQDEGFEKMQGESLFPMIKDQEKEDRIAFCETGGLYGPWPSRDKHNVFCIRYKDKKIIYNNTPNTWEFYNLKKDPKEEHNLINENLPEILEFKEMLLKKLRENNIK